jgi:multiple sugar transport system substrate-binding protein
MKRILISGMLLLGMVSLFANGAGDNTPKKQKLVFWGKQAQDRATDELMGVILKKWGEENNVDVEYTAITSEVQKQKYAAAFETKTVPDIITFDSDFCKYYATQKVLRPVDDLFRELNRQNGGFFSGVLPVLTEDGKLYGIPFQNDIYFFYVRKDLVEGVGEKLPETWDDVARISRKIKAKYHIDPFGHPLSEINDTEYTTRTILWSYGAHIYDRNGNVDFNTPQTLQVFRLLRTMYEDDQTIPKGAVTWNDSSNNEAYQMKKAAFIINPGSVFRWAKENDKELYNNTAVCRIPAGPGGLRANLTSCWAVCIPVDSPNAALAKQCLEYLYRIENYNRIIESAGTRYLPVFRNLLNTPFWTGESKLSELGSMLEDAKVIGYPGPSTAAASNALVSRVLSKALADMVVQHMDPENAVKNADTAFRTLQKK